MEIINMVVDFTVAFVVVYLFYLFFIILRKKKLNTIKESSYGLVLSKNYKVDLTKISNMFLAQSVAVTNSFIIAFTLVCVGFIEGYFYKLLLAFAILVPLQMLIYLLMSKIMKRRNKNV